MQASEASLQYIFISIRNVQNGPGEVVGVMRRPPWRRIFGLAGRRPVVARDIAATQHENLLA